MRASWILVGVACGAPPGTLSNTGSPRPPVSPPCGFTDFSKLDSAAWRAASEYSHKVIRSDGTPLGSPAPVGSCRLDPIDPRKRLYMVRDGNVDVAEVNSEGTLVLVPGFSEDHFNVGMSSDVVLEKYPPDGFRIACVHEDGRNECSFAPIGVEVNAMHGFVVDGTLGGRLDGVAAYEFFRGKSLRGVHYFSRVD